MTTYPAAVQAACAAPISIAEVRDCILADETLPPARRQDIASALLRLAKALGLPADILLADPVDLRARLKGVTPKMVGIKPPRWKNILSLTRTALTRVGICVVPTRFDSTPAPAWTACLDLLRPAHATFRGDQKDQDRMLLGRFARYCTGIGIEPAQIDDGVLARFHQDLALRSLVDGYDRAARDTAVRWNQVANSVPGWPQQRLTVADNRNIYAIPWDRFPPALTQDVNAWLGRLAAGSAPTDDDYFKPLRPASIVLRRKQMHLYLSALVLTGEDPASMVDLASVVTPGHVDRGLRFFQERKGETQSLHIGQIAAMVLGCAKHWTNAPASTVRAIRNALRRTMPKTGGMTEKNQALLDQFEDVERLRTLLTLPETILAEAVKEAPNLATARRMQMAVMIEILIKAPVRMENLTKAKVGVNLLPQSNGEMVLSVRIAEMKNGLAHQVRLRGKTVRLLQRYLDVDRPLLAQPGSPYLFPGKTADCPKTQEGLRAPMKALIAKRCGLKANPHLFRHLAGLLIIDDRIEAAPVVQRVLGHKRLETTENFYLSRKTKAAFDHLDELIERRRAGIETKPRPRVRRKGDG